MAVFADNHTRKFQLRFVENELLAVKLNTPFSTSLQKLIHLAEVILWVRRVDQDIINDPCELNNSELLL